MAFQYERWPSTSTVGFIITITITAFTWLTGTWSPALDFSRWAELPPPLEISWQAAITGFSGLVGIGCVALLTKRLREIAIRCALEDDLRRHGRLG